MLPVVPAVAFALINAERYYVPQSAITYASLKTSSKHEGYTIATASIGNVSVENVLIFSSKDLKDLVRFDFSAMDGWFEEDEPIYVHPKDPYKRVDIRRSSRHIKVAIEGVTVAETTGPTLLFETSLRTRYYLPATCVSDLFLLLHILREMLERL